MAAGGLCVGENGMESGKRKYNASAVLLRHKMMITRYSEADRNGGIIAYRLSRGPMSCDSACSFVRVFVQ